MAYPSYSVWSRDTYRTRIAQRVGAVLGSPLDAECGPGREQGQYRLYPGALFLLWTGAIGGPEAPGGAERVAAALEMLHNSSLVHDDVLDRHVLRRGQRTLLSACGHNYAVLAGDALMAGAMKTLAGVEASHLPGIITRLAEAITSMVTGQINDEPDVWAHVTNRQQHWLQVCLQKLAIGNTSSSLAAFWCGREDLESSVRSIMDEFSVVSQIMNDFGDLLDFAGYHEVDASRRPRGEESSRKPTLPLIWAEAEQWSQIDNIGPLYDRAKREIERRKCVALAAIERLNLFPDFVAVLSDFFVRPSLPKLE